MEANQDQIDTKLKVTHKNVDIHEKIDKDIKLEVMRTHLEKKFGNNFHAKKKQ